MFKKIYLLLKSQGIRGLFDALNLRLRSPLPCYRSYKLFFQDKIGLEIGGPTNIFKRNRLFPVYAVCQRLDNCNFSNQTAWEGYIQQGVTFQYDKYHPLGNQYISEASNLNSIPSATYDFLLSSHTLEHIANPLKALSEWVRVLKDGGIMVLVLPHKEGTFDHLRPITSLEHLIQDFEVGVTEQDLTHLEEILALHDLSRSPEFRNFDEFKSISIDNPNNRCLHHHVFDTRLGIKVINHVGLQILAFEVFRPYHILIIAQKPLGNQVVDNKHFLAINQTPCWSSPFASDNMLQ